MANHVIITPKVGSVGDRSREKVANLGNRFIPVTEQNGILLVFTLDGQQGLAFNQREADWEIVEAE